MTRQESDMSEQPEPEDEKSHRGRWIALGVAGIVVLAAVGGVLWWLSGDVPVEASIEGALGAVTTSGETDVPVETDPPLETDAPTATEAPIGTTTVDTTTVESLDGSWAVDPTIGDFSFEEATASFVGFRINEQLAGVGETEAVGRTPEVSGTLEMEGTTVTEVVVEAQMDAIVTNDSRRDNGVRGALNTNEFPTGRFVLTEPIDLGTEPVDGETVTATAVGDLTIAGVTNPVEFAIEAQLRDGLIVVVGRTDIVFADYDVEVPSGRIVLSVEDNGIVELQLWFSRA